MRLVIAEKPSVAESIAAALSPNFLHRKGYMEYGEWLISWCYGHLAELADAHFYNSDYKAWRLSDLPIIPESFKFHVKEGKRTQFDVLKELMRRSDVVEVINACDAGREGELIFRTVYHLAGCSKPMKRLWVSSMEAQALRDGMENLRPGSDYDGLHQSALCRAKADWLVGINASRFFSLIFGQTLNVGRVMSPTLALLAQRDAEIAAFTPEPYYHVNLHCGINAVSPKFKDRSEAEAIAQACEGQSITVKKVERKVSTEKPPVLYDLTTLQRDANRLLGFTAQQTLDYAQALYEKKLLTYPRTDSTFLTSDMAETAACVLRIAAKQPPFDKCHDFFPDVTLMISDADVSDHHALIPTMEVEQTYLHALPEAERKLLLLVCCKLLCASAEAYVTETTTVTFLCAGQEFIAKGKRVISLGWKEIDRLFREYLSNGQPKNGKDISMPEFTEGQVLPPCTVKVTDHMTTPPKHFTEDTLLSAMENTGNSDSDQEAERRGIGTPATRAGILEKLIAANYVQRKGGKKATHLCPTQTGNALITVLSEELQSPQLTAEWEHRLKEVERGRLDAAEFMADISSMLESMVKSYTAPPGSEVLFPPAFEVVGKCPRCGGQVVENGKGFFCDNKECRFAMWKNSYFFSSKRKTLTAKIAAELLKKGKAALKGCYSIKQQKTYDATVILDDDGEHVGYKLEFYNG